jgi:hypothetical protein
MTSHEVGSWRAGRSTDRRRALSQSISASALLANSMPQDFMVLCDAIVRFVVGAICFCGFASLGDTRAEELRRIVHPDD